METLATVFGRRLRLLRKAKNLTQEQLGKKADIDYKHIGAIERGVKTLSNVNYKFPITTVIFTVLS